MIPGDGTIRVFDKNTGAERTVNPLSSTAQTYLTATGEGRKAFRAYTVEDNTFVTNREVNTAMAAAKSAVQDNVVLFWVRQAFAAAWFHINMNADYSGPWSTVVKSSAAQDNQTGVTFNDVTITKTVDDPVPMHVADVQGRTAGSGGGDDSTSFMATRIWYALEASSTSTLRRAMPPTETRWPRGRFWRATTSPPPRSPSMAKRLWAP